MEWLTNFNNAVNYIESNLAGDISYDEAARLACSSTFYFQRMFAYVAGISLSDYIRRRMTQAAFDLQNSDSKVIDIACKYGYTSPTAFNRAFQTVHGIAPTAARHKGAVLNAYPPLRISVQISGGDAMAYQIEDRQEMRIVGIRVPLSMNMDENHMYVPQFWKRSLENGNYARICEMACRTTHQILGVSIYLGPDEFYYYIAAQTDEPAPDGMYEYTIPASSWAVFNLDGRFKESVQSIFRRFITEWLPFSGYSYAELPDIEIYPCDKGMPPCGQSSVLIGIKENTNGVHN